MVDAVSTTTQTQALSSAKTAPKTTAETKADGEASAPRAIRDTVEIGGNKIVNLARAQELAAALPDATQDRDAFDAALSAAQEDVSRITQLFQSTLADLVSSWQPSALGVEGFSETVTAGQSEQSRPSVQELQQILDRALRDARRISEQVAETLRRVAPVDIQA